MYVCFHVVEVFKLFMIIEESDLPPKTTSNVGPSQFDYDQTSSSFSLFFCEIIVRRNEELPNFSFFFLSLRLSCKLSLRLLIAGKGGF